MSKPKNKNKKDLLVGLTDNHYKNRTDLVRAIQLLGEIKRERDRIKNKTDDQISKLQLDLQKDILPFDLRIQHIASGVKYFVDHHKTELFPNPEYKTCKLTTGVLKLRKLPASVKTRGNAEFLEKILSENRILEKLNTLVSKLGGLYIRLKLELDKERILADPLRAEQKIGIELNEESERLYITPNETEIEIEVGLGVA
ncbi:host-nuclease inhibitor Gam family protein [Leptospira adleri]|uniref:Nuclease inhibitor n=1 Tax=Leptospira adleri TaxID=2023186 RepID=A0ABX4P266_9LEPT|nr:host-nuclease inhibitor Gam family protein [Leptospira adleri]PJZ62857.1 nuclease inhibitor [Leptospira adleri]